MQIIPLKPIPNQTLQVQLAGQACILNIYQLDYGLFMDVYVNTDPKANAVICEDRNRIVRYPYLGFVGDFIFIDNQGTTDPTYDGLGSRYSLAYLEAADLASAA